MLGFPTTQIARELQIGYLWPFYLASSRSRLMLSATNSARRSNEYVMDSLKLKTPGGVGMKSEVEESFGGKVLQFRGKRQALLAANLANADTPNFKALDVSFAESLREAAKRDNALHAAAPPLKAASQRHLGPVTLGGQDTLAFARSAAPALPRLDGGTVDMDVERGNIMQNVILYQMAMVRLGDDWRNSRQRLPILVAKAIERLGFEAALAKFEVESAAG